MARRRSFARRSTARAISAGLKRYWKTVRAVQRQTGRSIKNARTIVRKERSRGLTHTAIRGKPRGKFTLTRERDSAMPAPKGSRPRPSEPSASQTEIDSLDQFIEEYDDAEDFDEIEIEATPTYADRGK